MDGVILRMEDIMLGVGIFDVEVSVDVLVLKWVVYDRYIYGGGGMMGIIGMDIIYPSSHVQLSLKHTVNFPIVSEAFPRLDVHFRCISS